MSYTLRDKTEIKIFILYILMHTDRPCDFVTLHDMVVKDEIVGQFDFMECFFELAETELLQKSEKNGKEYFTVTPKGKEAAKMLENDLPRAMRSHALRSAHRYLSFRLRGEKAHSAVIESADGKYRLECECADQDGVYMRASVVMPSKRDAELAKLNFDDRSEIIYKGLMSLLSGDVNYLAPYWDESEDRT